MQTFKYSYRRKKIALFPTANNYLLGLVVLLATVNAHGQIEGSNNSGTKSKINVIPVCNTSWNTPDGLDYITGVGMNHGATAVQSVDETTIAYLCDGSSKIYLVNILNGQTITSFNVAQSPTDFVYEDSTFFVLQDFNIISYNSFGEQLSIVSFPSNYSGVMRITRDNGTTYLLLPNGNSIGVERNGLPIITKEITGWICSDNKVVNAFISGNNSYEVNLNLGSELIYKNNFTTGAPIAGVYVIGTYENYIYLDIQTWISYDPINVKRSVVCIDIKKPSKNISEILVPDMYYVFVNHDIYLSNGKLYHLITSPKAAHLFNISFNDPINNGYPVEISNVKYHFNDHIESSNQ